MSLDEETPPRAGHGPADAAETVRANRRWWDGAASGYLAEHGGFLGHDQFVWCPEGLTEDEAHLLGPIAELPGRRVLEVGCGAGQCSRWLAARGTLAVGVDLSAGMITSGTGRLRPPRPGTTGSTGPWLIQADARRLPFADACFDLAFSAYGAVPFVADPERIMAEVARVLRPGGRWVFSVTHPIRWAFPDDPGPAGLTAVRSYFDTTAYTERLADGRLAYAEHHRTMGQRLRDLVAAGLVVEDVVEPRWPQGHDRVWGGWSPLRGRLIPGTAIFCARKPPDAPPRPSAHRRAAG